MKYRIKFIDIFKNKKLLLNETKNDNDWKIKIINELLDFNVKVKMDSLSKEKFHFLVHKLLNWLVHLINYFNLRNYKTYS